MNKKVFSAMVAVLMILALVLVGCSKPSEGTVSGQQSSQGGTAVEDWDDIVPEVNNSSGNNNSSSSQSGSQSDSSSVSQSGSSSGNSSSSGSSSSSAGQEDYGLPYEEYLAMNPAQQQAYFESFDSFADYVAWYNAAKADYEANRDSIQVEGDGGFNIGDYIN